MHHELEEILSRALFEDIGERDWTTDAIVQNGETARGVFVAKTDGIVAGWDAVLGVFQVLDAGAEVEIRIRDGQAARAGETLGSIRARTAAILSGERTALNIFQRMSGIATLTRSFVERVRGTNAVILDTRKTAPGLRFLDKMAVRIGGGENHRFGLFDMILIKENHIAAAGSMQEAVSRVRSRVTPSMKIELEVRNLRELEEALRLQVDRILLDNMSVDEMTKAVGLTQGRVPLEASGSITLDNVNKVAATGVQFISVGQLTHSVKAMDISLLIERSQEGR